MTIVATILEAIANNPPGAELAAFYLEDAQVDEAAGELASIASMDAGDVAKQIRAGEVRVAGLQLRVAERRP